MRIGEPNFSVGDNNKAIRILKWEPNSIREIIYKVVNETICESE